MERKSETGNRRNVLIDSSSTILLFKSGLLDTVIEYYDIIMTESVFNELTQSNHTGSDEIKQFAHNNLIKILSAQIMKKPLESEHISGRALGRGERDSIISYLHGVGDFIIIDDGKGAGYCKKYEIPYINALLVPRIMRIAKTISDVEFELSTRTIIGCGRYSEKIIEYAQTCTDENLNLFI